MQVASCNKKKTLRNLYSQMLPIPIGINAFRAAIRCLCLIELSSHSKLIFTAIQIDLIEIYFRNKHRATCK